MVFLSTLGRTPIVGAGKLKRGVVGGKGEGNGSQFVCGDHGMFVRGKRVGCYCTVVTIPC